MSELERARKRLEHKKVLIAAEEHAFKILELKDKIKWFEEQIEIQKARALELEKELKGE